MQDLWISYADTRPMAQIKVMGLSFYSFVCSLYSWIEPWILWTKIESEFANGIIWQHSTEAANKSRFVTKVGWIVATDKQFRALSNELPYYQIQFACDCVIIVLGVIKTFLGRYTFVRFIKSKSLWVDHLILLTDIGSM